MMKRTLLSVLTLGLFVSAQPLQAADNPLEAIPDTAGAVIRFATPKTTVEKVLNALNEIDPQVAAQARPMSQAIGLGISNPTMTGVDQEKDWWVGVFPQGQADPAIVYMIPANNITAMKETLGPAFHFQTYDEKWAIYTDHKQTSKLIERRLQGKGKSISGLMDKTSSRIVNGSDTAIFLNIAQLTKDYGEDLEQARAEAMEEIEQMQNLSPETPGVNPAAIGDISKTFVNAFFQAIDDTEAIAAGMTFSKDGASIEEYAAVTRNSPTAKILQNHPPAEMAILNSLPKNKSMYMGMHGDFNAMVDWAMYLASQMFQDNDETKKQLADVSKQMKDIKFGTYAGAIWLGDLKDGVLRVATVTEVDQTDKLRKVMIDYSKVSGDAFQVEGVKQEIKVTQDAEKIEGKSIDVITMKQEITDPNLDPLGMQKQINSVIYGPNGMVQRMAYLPNAFVSTIGTKSEIMQEALKAFSGKQKNESLAKTRGELLTKANAVFLIDVPGVVVDAMRIVAESGTIPIPVTPAQLNGISKEPSYIGISVSTSETGLHARTSVPMAQMKGIFKVVMLFQQMAQNQQL